MEKYTNQMRSCTILLLVILKTEPRYSRLRQQLKIGILFGLFIKIVFNKSRYTIVYFFKISTALSHVAGQDQYHQHTATRRQPEDSNLPTSSAIQSILCSYILVPSQTFNNTCTLCITSTTWSFSMPVC